MEMDGTISAPALVDEGHYCAHCDKDASDFKPRYRIIVRVQDAIANTSFALSNKETEDLVGVPMDKIIADLPKDTNFIAIPPAIKNIVGKKCAFEIKITSYNTQRSYEEYIVFCLSECVDEKHASPPSNIQGRLDKKPKNESQ